MYGDQEKGCRRVPSNKAAPKSLPWYEEATQGQIDQGDTKGKSILDRGGIKYKKAQS